MSTKTIIGYEVFTSNGDGSYSTEKFKTMESAERWLQAEEKSEYFEGPCDAGPYPVYAEDFVDHEYGE